MHTPPKMSKGYANTSSIHMYIHRYLAVSKLADEFVNEVCS